MRNNFKWTVVLSVLLGTAVGTHADDFNPAGVIVESLPELSLNTLGTQKTTNPLLWSETPAVSLLDLVEKAGRASLTPAQRRLITHLLSLDITGTSFQDETDILGEKAFLVARLEALFRQGEWQQVSDIMALIPEADLSDNLLKIKREMLLLKGDIQEACAELDEKETSLDADKWRIACFIAQEEKDKAALSYDIYQEKKAETSSLFAVLAENVLREIPTDLPAKAVLEPIDVYLASLYKGELDWSAQLRAVRLTLADLPTTDIPLRIALAEKSGLTLEALKKIYRLPLFKPDLTNHAVKRAWLHQQLMQTSDEKQKVSHLKEFLALVKEDKLFVNLAPVIVDILNTIKPNPAYIDVAFDAVQAYSLDNNLSLAAPWFELLQDSEEAVYRKQLFLLTPIWQSMGGGYPENLSKQMNRYCGANPIAECARLKRFIPPELYQSITASDDLTLSPTEKPVSEAAKTTRLGETLLRAVLNINAQTELEKSYAVIQLLAQPDKRDALLREEMIFE